jgi:hypothetical protein
VTRRGLLLALVAVGAAVAGIVATLARTRRDREVATLRADLNRAASATAADESTASPAGDADDLPPPVARYLSTATGGEAVPVQQVVLTQSGEFRTGDADSPWRPFSATQHVTTDPPGFVWEAAIEMAPFVSARVVDSFVDGEGSLRATVFSVLTVADAASDPQLDEGELMRYLGETPWYPSALGAGGPVSWEPLDDRSARATLSVGETTASLVFHFGEDDLVQTVTGERPAQQDDGSYEPTPWSGHWWDYERREGVLVPTEGRAEWNGPTGTLAYWRGHLESMHVN